jgi:DNA-binding MarR family transcriptional regulator
MEHPAATGSAPEPAGASGAAGPSVLGLDAYLMYVVGKAARRRLTDRLAAHGLRLWHLTVLAMIDDLGPQMKTVLAARLDMNASDLVKTVRDLENSGHVTCERDRVDRRRVVVALTPLGASLLQRLTREIGAADAELLSPLSPRERAELTSLLHRIHLHVTPVPGSRRPV